MQDERDFFIESIHQCESGMYTLAFEILRNEDDAADVIQESILKAYCSLDVLRDKKRFRPWMMSIIHNTAIEFLRKNRNLVDWEAQEEPAAPEVGVDRDTKLTVREAVQRLRLPYRLVIILFYYQSYSVKQISTITSTPAAAVRQQLSRGRKMLASMLCREDFVQ